MVVSIVVGTDGDSMDRVLMRCIEVLASSTLLVSLVSLSTTCSASGGVHTSSGLHGVLSMFMQWRYLCGVSMVTHSIEGPKGELVVSIHSTAQRL